MRVLNLIWGFATGGGIDKCFLTYAKIPEVSSDTSMINVCIRPNHVTSHLDQLELINTKVLPINSRLDLSWIRKLKAIIREEEPDVLFSHGFNGAIVLWIERLLGVKQKIILTYHGLYNPPTPSRRVWAALFNNLPIWIYRNVAHTVICVSEDSRQQIIRRKVPESKVVTVYNGIAESVSGKKVKMNQDEINLITCSRIDGIKGLNYLLDALAKLKSDGLRFHYYMIGDGPELDNLKRLCSHLAMDEYVTFTGYKNNVDEWLNGADIFVIPSLQENHSIAVLEAMRAGKAIIATKVGGNGESLRNEVDGLLIKPCDVESLYEALKRLIHDEELRDRLSFSAKKRFMEKFTVDVMLKNVLGVLEG